LARRRAGSPKQTGRRLNQLRAPSSNVRQFFGPEIMKLSRDWPLRARDSQRIPKVLWLGRRPRAGCGPYRPQLLRVIQHDPLTPPFRHEPPRREAVSSTLHQNIENETMLVDRAPKPIGLASDRDDDLASRAGESHPHALPEPYVTLSSHTAPDVRPFACRKRQWAKR
jgi:hypothetical protein